MCLVYVALLLVSFATLFAAMMTLLAARKQAAKEAWLQLTAGDAAQASSVTIYENLATLMLHDGVSTRKGFSFWVPVLFHFTLLPISLHHQVSPWLLVQVANIVTI